ncbi:MAG: S-layer homology domain-containing protein [Agathobaculum sp.]|uniref:S-layer homology domain-containing protein n=1 Tax=Agathobaculum sp. TaxID=2048138 RepID=UPI0025C2FEE7|nr:S-layer homology domain-containing protein [Agathobaculum sp.]MCI7125501.1 S-layer homology domain-containing protein [Agathobaculum sp.]MDY3712448.1 S-layer homology domain-containing protein [Agathobaculum sp.]
MKKRMVSAWLCVVMLVSMMPAALAASDIDNHWAQKFIRYLDDEGVINPSATTGKYEPDREMTRAEFMRYINRAFHFTEKAAINYTDVKSSAWYYETVQIATKYGYINGVGNNKMEPEGKITREQAAVVIGRLFKADVGDISPSDLPFTDKKEISNWSAGYIKAAADKGFLAGYADGSFQPGRVVTRGEVAKILYYYMGTALSTAGKAYTGADLKSDTTNVTISENCTLSDATIEGDLYLTEGLGANAVTLTNVKVNGSIIVSGGTVAMVNTISDHMILSSPMGRLLQTTATGETAIAQTDVASMATMYEKGLTGEGYTAITVNGDKRVSLTLDAAVTELDLVSEATVSTAASTDIYHLTTRRPASITGYGSIYQADIQDGGVSFASSVAVIGYTLADGVRATIGGQTVSASSKAGVSPSNIEVDRSDLSALGTGVMLSLPSGKTVSSVQRGGTTLSPSTDYVAAPRGIQVLPAFLGSLGIGKHTLVLSLSDGTTTTVMVTVSDSSAQKNASPLSFDRYYKANDFKDMAVKLEGVNAAGDILDVVLGMSQLDFSFDSARRALVLRRGLLAQLRQGVYTITVDLKNGEQRLIELTVTDSTPSGQTIYIAEYDTYAPSEPAFPLPLDQLTVKSVSAIQNNEEYALNAGVDFEIGARSLTLKKSTLEKYRISKSYIEFHVTMSDDSVCILVVDYVS